MARVGILGYQGCIEPHERMFAQAGAETVRVRKAEDLDGIDRLVLPGGESTTMLRFIDRYALSQSIQTFAASKPIWGICAGAILIAREVSNPTQRSLNLIDIRATRNFYGSQLESFATTCEMPGLLGRSIVAQLIRAPRLSSLPQSSGRPQLIVEGQIHGIDQTEQQPVFFSQGRVWASSFHVELGSDKALHEAFLAL